MRVTTQVVTVYPSLPCSQMEPHNERKVSGNCVYNIYRSPLKNKLLLSFPLPVDWDMGTWLLFRWPVSAMWTWTTLSDMEKQGRARLSTWPHVAQHYPPRTTFGLFQEKRRSFYLGQTTVISGIFVTAA